jgi:hypothetical protein
MEAVKINEKRKREIEPYCEELLFYCKFVPLFKNSRGQMDNWINFLGTALGAKVLSTGNSRNMNVIYTVPRGEMPLERDIILAQEALMSGGVIANIEQKNPSDGSTLRFYGVGNANIDDQNNLEEIDEDSLHDGNRFYVENYRLLKRKKIFTEMNPEEHLGDRSWDIRVGSAIATNVLVAIVDEGQIDEKNLRKIIYEKMPWLERDKFREHHIQNVLLDFVDAGVLYREKDLQNGELVNYSFGDYFPLSK